MTRRYYSGGWANCHKCGKFVGKGGDLDIFTDLSGYTEIGYPTCRICLEKEESSRVVEHGAGKQCLEGVD